MQASHPSLPDLRTLTAGLTSLFDGTGSPARPVAVLNRQPNSYAGSSRSEIVTCRLADATEFRLLCKYEASTSHSDVAYEGEVYRQVLQPIQTSTPTFYGTHSEAAAGRTWLVIQYLEDSVPLGDMWDRAAMQLAAAWVGRFHAASDAHFAGARLPFLNVFDVGYYLACARRALQFAGPSPGADFPWLPALGRQFEGFVGPLWGARATVSHGDYYPHNILCRGGAVYPIDWESAALDLGEMDLACLTDGWPADLARQCEAAYRQARWPGGAPADSERALGAARLCLFFYNLANRPDWPGDPQGRWYARQLRSVGEQLGLI